MTPQLAACAQPWGPPALLSFQHPPELQRKQNVFAQLVGSENPHSVSIDRWVFARFPSRQGREASAVARVLVAGLRLDAVFFAADFNLSVGF